MEPRASLTDHLQRLARLPERSTDGDIEALMFTVMFEAAATEQAALSESMARLKAINEAKRSKRLGKDALDSLSELGEMESLRLQMAMDRLSKMMSTLSNILKKTADTAATITQNLK